MHLSTKYFSSSYNKQKIQQNFSAENNVTTRPAKAGGLRKREAHTYNAITTKVFQSKLGIKKYLDVFQ